jgi:hypothetical protein
MTLLLAQKCLEENQERITLQIFLSSDFTGGESA